jgi:putative addiction module component (TIGR02574 family)
MTPASKSIVEAALNLTPEEREEIADQLWRSLDVESSAEIDAAWAEEADRRYQAYKRGEVKAKSLEEIRDGLRNGEKQ